MLSLSLRDASKPIQHFTIVMINSAPEEQRRTSSFYCQFVSIPRVIFLYNMAVAFHPTSAHPRASRKCRSSPPEPSLLATATTECDQQRAQTLRQHTAHSQFTYLKATFRPYIDNRSLINHFSILPKHDEFQHVDLDWKRYTQQPKATDEV